VVSPVCCVGLQEDTKSEVETKKRTAKSVGTN